MLLAGCTGDDEPSEPQLPSRSPKELVAPERGGTVVFGVVGEPATLDPYSLVASDLTYALVRPVYPSLFRFEPDGTPVTYLAQSFERVDGGVRVTLRDVSWSDGTRIASDDVLASIKRARPPSGFAEITSARAVSPRVVELRGSVEDWPRTLARVAFVLPGGEARRVSGGPFRIAERVPGLKIVYKHNRSWWRPAPYVDRIVVEHLAGLDTLLNLLARGRIDAGAPPSALNLDHRLDSPKVEHVDALGYESIYLDMEGAEVDKAVRESIAAAIDRPHLDEGFARDDGRVANTLRPEPGPAGADGPWSTTFFERREAEDSLQLAAPAGDELALLIQRVIQLELDNEGFDIEPVTSEPFVFYGDWQRDDPIDLAVRRSAGAPGLTDPRGAFDELAALPLLHVETVLAWRDGINGLVVNPTFEGPLWNAEDWWVSKEKKGSG